MAPVETSPFMDMSSGGNVLTLDARRTSRYLGILAGVLPIEGQRFDEGIAIAIPSITLFSASSFSLRLD